MMLRSRTGIRWAACTQAGCVYALIVFAVGFALGTIRVLLLVPRLGETVAVLLEAPLMLAVSWYVSKRVAKRLALDADVEGSLTMGAIAFVVLTIAELGVGMLVFGKTVAEYLASYGSVSGVIGLAAQICFATFPFLRASRK